MVALAPKKHAKHGSEEKKAKRKNRRRRPSYQAFIYKRLKLKAPDTGVSKRAMVIFDHILQDLIDRIGREAGNLARSRKRVVIGAREIQTACKLIFSGELSTVAVGNGLNHVARYRQSFPPLM